MPKVRGFLKIMTERLARGYNFLEGRGWRALSEKWDLMDLSIVLEPVGHY